MIPYFFPTVYNVSVNRRTGLRRKAAMVIWMENRNLGGGALECGRL